MLVQSGWPYTMDDYIDSRLGSTPLQISVSGII
jgi:hypothetical protein